MLLLGKYSHVSVKLKAEAASWPFGAPRAAHPLGREANHFTG